ncbi:MAG TPA: alpha/beta fold hydrolase [Candidatus Saccharimonadales bacterium]|nr:alpha/beta fold hydrolase [Candidatus Saccharimonadales bacterium]
MKKQVLFIQGAGGGAYDEDATLAESLRQILGSDYEVRYPAMPDEENVPYDAWKACIEQELARMEGPVMVVGHSVGGSVLLKCLGEIETAQPIAGIFVAATPFWGGAGWTYEGYEQLALPADSAARLPDGAPIFLYHCKDDSTVPFDHMALFQQLLPHATSRSLDEGGHQFNQDMTVVAKDIQEIR